LPLLALAIGMDGVNFRLDCCATGRSLFSVTKASDLKSRPKRLVMDPELALIEYDEPAIAINFAIEISESGWTCVNYVTSLSLRT